MNFFESELRQMFTDNDIIHDPKIVGKTLLGKLDDDLRVKLQFFSTGTAGHYDAILIAILNRTEGAVDRTVMTFCDILSSKNGCGTPNRYPYIWEQSCHKADWYSPLSVTEKAQIADAVLDYVGMYQNEGMDMSL